MHLGSYFTSLLLHGLALLAVIFWPASRSVRLDQPTLQISMTLGDPGGDMLPSPVLGHQTAPEPSEAVAKPAPPAPEAAPVPVPEAVPAPEQQPKPEAPARPAPPQPEAVPIPQKPEPEKPKEEPKPKAPEKPKEQPKPREPEKPREKPAPKETPKKNDKPKTPKPEDALKAALADARNKTKSTGSKSPVSGALNDLKRTAGEQGGGGGSGAGPGGGGLYDVYMGQVITAIRPNWAMAIYSRQNLVVDIWIKISPAGEILDSRVERSSGRAEFDGSALNAVRRTRQLPPPPTADQQELIVSFNSQDTI